MAFCCCQCGATSGPTYVEVAPCLDCLCARCYHQVTVQGAIGVCPSCSTEIRSSSFIQYDSDTGAVEREDPILHASIFWRVGCSLYQRVKSRLVTLIANPYLLIGAVTPDKNPLLWVIINTFVVLYALFLLACVWHAQQQGHKALKFADQSYLVYDFTTTFIWVVETFLGAATSFAGGGGSHIFSKCASLIHLVIAFFFLMDSLVTLHKWKWKKEDIIVDAVWVVGDLLAYSMVLVETLVYTILTRHRRQYSEIGDESNETVHHDPLLARVWPFYESLQSKVEKRPSKSLRTKDWTKLLEALHPTELFPDNLLNGERQQGS